LFRQLLISRYRRRGKDERKEKGELKNNRNFSREKGKFSMLFSINFEGI